MSAYDHGLIPIIDGITLYTFIDEGMLTGVLLSAKLIGLKKAIAYLVTQVLLKTTCSGMGVTPKQATRVMVPWGGTALLSQFALRQSPELHKTTRDYWLHRRKFRKAMKAELPEETLEGKTPAELLKEELIWEKNFNRFTFLQEILSDQGFGMESCLPEPALTEDGNEELDEKVEI